MWGSYSWREERVVSTGRCYRVMGGGLLMTDGMCERKSMLVHNFEV